MRRLKELEIVIKEPLAGKFKTYRLNPHIAQKVIKVNNKSILTPM